MRPAGRARAREAELIRVTEGVYAAHAFGTSNALFVVTARSIVVIDTTNNLPTAGAALVDLRNLCKLPVSHIIYTHCHDDHIGGARAFYTPATRVVAQRSLPGELVKNDRLLAYRQLRPGVEREGYVPPDVLVDACYHFEEGGIAFELAHTPGETADHMMIWLPGAKVLFPGDLFTNGFPMLSGPLYLDPPVLTWAQSLERMRQLRADYLVPSRGRPLAGAAAIDEALGHYADAIRFVHDATVRGIDEGLTLEQIRARVRLPDRLAQLPYLQERYGTVAWAVTGIFRQHVGWYRGNPKDLDPSPQAVLYQVLLEGWGGGTELTKRARQALTEGRSQLALELIDIVLGVAENDGPALAVRGEALGRLAEVATSRVARRIYRAVANERSLGSKGTAPPEQPERATNLLAPPLAVNGPAVVAAASKHRHGFVDVAGLRLHYLDYGGGGEAVIALPGLLQNARAADAIAPVLTPHVRLLSLDLRGRGGSGWAPPDSYKWPYYLTDISGFLEALGLTRFALIGTSLGGTLAMMYAMAHPDQVTRLVLNDIALNTNRPGVIRTAQRFGQAPAEFAGLAEAKAWFLAGRGDVARLGPEVVAAWVAQYLTPTSTGTLRFNCDPALISRAGMTEDQIGPRVPWSHRPAVWEQARRLLSMPVLLLRGALSDVVLPESAQQTVQALPAARCVEVPGVGHSPTLYEPEAQAALREFFGVPVPR